MNKLIILFLLTLVQNIEIRDDLPIFDVDKLDRLPYMILIIEKKNSKMFLD